MFNYLMLVSAIVFLLLDFIYLNLIKNYFNKQIKDVQGSEIKINFMGVVLCYIILILGINYFIINPRKSVMEAFLLGMLIYGVYETTNYALFKNWSIITVIIDTLWGGILFAVTTYIVNIVRNKYIK